MITIERSYSFFLLLLIIPVAVFSVIKFRRVTSSLGILYVRENSFSKNLYLKLRFSVALRTIFNILAWICGVFAFAGISWGDRAFPVRKSSDAVSFVFDISYSMNAMDGPGRLSRLECAKNYAFELLSRMEDVSVSIVLAKGDGVVAVPLTDDKVAVELILNSLSPTLMTSAGSSIGKGITASLMSFPQNSAQAPHIWVFTDGDETDSSMENSIEEAVKFGFPVTLIGFGSKNGADIIAGDGKTPVHTVLQEEKMRSIVQNANKRRSAQILNSTEHAELAKYVPAAEEGSGTKILQELSDKKVYSQSFEVKRIERHGIFILLGLMFFILSFILSEFNIPNLKPKISGSEKPPAENKTQSSKQQKSRKSSLLSLIFSLFVIVPLFVSCDSGKTSILKGTWLFYQKEYQSATGNFLRTFSENPDSEAAIYAEFALASTYLMQEEYEAALSRLEHIPPDADKKLSSAAFYNAGIIENRRGNYEKAAGYFKKSILADPKNKQAKMNLEFTLEQAHEKEIAQNSESEVSAVSSEKDNSLMEKAVFNLIKEEEQKQWKKLETAPSQNSTLDY